MTYNTTDIDAGLAAMEAAAPGQAEKGCCFACAMVEVSRLAYPDLLIVGDHEIPQVGGVGDQVIPHPAIT